MWLDKENKLGRERVLCIFYTLSQLGEEREIFTLAQQVSIPCKCTFLIPIQKQFKQQLYKVNGHDIVQFSLT